MNVYLMIGAPGAGKSTYVEKNLSNFSVISCDEIRENKFGFVRSYEIRCAVFDVMLSTASSNFERRIDFVIDSTYFNGRESRKALFKTLPANYITAIFINTSLEICSKQNLGRAEHRVINRDMIEYLYNQIDAPSQSEGFKDVKVINNN